MKFFCLFSLSKVIYALYVTSETVVADSHRITAPSQFIRKNSQYQHHGSALVAWYSSIGIKDFLEARRWVGSYNRTHLFTNLSRSIRTWFDYLRRSTWISKVVVCARNLTFRRTTNAILIGKHGGFVTDDYLGASWFFASNHEDTIIAR